MKTNKILTLLFLVIAGYVQGFAQQNDSLLFYLEEASKNNPVVLQKYAEYEASLEKLPQLGSLPDPELSLGVFLSPMELIGGNQVADLRLMQMFPWFGVLKSSKDEMSLMAQANFESFRNSKLQLYFEVRKAWCELYRIQNEILISEKNLEMLHTIERLALTNFKSGGGSGSSVSNVPASSTKTTPNSSGMSAMSGNAAGTTSQVTGNTTQSMPGNTMVTGSSSGLADLYRVQMEIGELENSISLLKAQKNLRIAKFNAFLNRPLLTSISIPDSLNSGKLHIPLKEIPDSILVNNPMLEMLVLEQKSLEIRKQMQQKMSYPMIGLGLNYSIIGKNPMSTAEMNGKDMIMPMLTVTLPIYRKKYKAMQNETEFLKTARANEIQETSNLLQTEYFEAVVEYEDAERRMKLYSKQHELAQQTLNIMLAGFSNGSAELSEVLRIRMQTLEYELNKTNALVDYSIAIARLNSLMDQ